MPKNELVSVIMPAFRMGRFIAEALASVGAQTYGDWEVIVVDDHAPEDGTADLVQAFAKAWPGKRVELIRHEVNRGVSAARNTAIRAAQGEFLAFLDPDDRWFPDHLKKSMDLFKSRPELDVTAGPVEVHATKQDQEVVRVHPKENWPYTFFPHSLTLYNFITTCATVVRSSALDEVGVFDEDPKIQHIEDYDLLIRLAEGRKKFGFLKEPTSVYRIHGQGATADLERMQRLHNYFGAKHPDFLRYSNARLQKQAMDQNEQVMQRLAELEHMVNGPMFRVSRLVDKALRRVWRSMRGKRLTSS
jgi:glycosyltransferase involved in cell wall biosynthesis